MSLISNIKQLVDRLFRMSKIMRYLFLLIFVILASACREEEDSAYTGRELEYDLDQVTPEYNYRGKILFKELQTGALEIHIELMGERAAGEHYFPAHLHYGKFELPHAPMAVLLNPVDIRTLKSVTVSDSLADGESFAFEDIQDFDGHVKVHLAEDGPDYHVILVAGNIGRNVHTP